MADYSIFVLGEDDITLSDGQVLSGFTQGDGSHLVTDPPTTLRLDARNWQEIKIRDTGDSNFADNDTSQRLFDPDNPGGTQTLDGVTYAEGRVVEAEYQLLLEDPATGEQYRAIGFNIREPGSSSPSYGTIEGLAFIDDVPPVGTDLTIISASEGPPNSGANATDASTYVPICFVAGTMIATPSGEVAVETLTRGDAVTGYDGRVLTVSACYQSVFSRRDLEADPRLRPVTIAAGALGAGLPARNLSVSRQHRMLVSSPVAERMFGVREVLIPAHKLAGLPGIAQAEPAGGVRYVHVLFDAHEIILANGAPSESLFTGPQALKSIPPEAREELRAILPEAVSDAARPSPARLIPDGHRQSRLVARHAKTGKQLLT